MILRHKGLYIYMGTGAENLAKYKGCTFTWKHEMKTSQLRHRGCTFTQEQEPKSPQKQELYIYMETRDVDLTVKTLGLYI